MNESYPVPTPELVKQWYEEWDVHPDAHCDSHGWVAARAAAWTVRELARASEAEDARLASATLIRSVMERALKDTAAVHWRVAGGPEDGAQIVRVGDLMAWAEQTASGLEQLNG